MPGLSLWLMLRPGNPFEKTAQELISETLPPIFLSKDDQVQTFPPHVTITSDIQLPEGTQPQEWLEKLDSSAYIPQKNEVTLELLELQAEDPFFRKCNIAIKDDSNLKEFASQCRKAANLSPEPEGGYRPHFSLYYGDTPTKDVQNKLALIEMKLGFAVGDLFACCGGALCMGGQMVLVDTSKPITEWKDAVVAKRETPWVTWKVSKMLC